MNYIVLANAVSVTLDDGDNHVINNTHPNYSKIIAALKSKDWKSVASLINIPKYIETTSKGAVEVRNGQVYHKGLPVHSYLATRMLEIMEQGFDIKPWTLFMEKLYQNPDPFSITQLYTFLERAKLPICPDGDFLAYKYVRKDFMDCHSGTFDNSVGQTPTMDRALCDNNPDNHCSRGLHFCSKGYIGEYGNTQNRWVMLVKVNPRDVVSVPNDHNCEKARACRYVVVGILNEDYTFEDMEASAVLPSPRNVGDLNKKGKVTPTKGQPTELQKKVLKSVGTCVRELSKNTKVTQADIINSAGEFYKFCKAPEGTLGTMYISITPKGTKWLRKNS